MTDQSQAGTFTPVNHSLAREVGLVCAAVYGEVKRHCGLKDGICKASLDTLGEGLSVNRATVMRNIKTLCELGYLIDQTPGLRNVPHTYILGKSVAERNSTVKDDAVQNDKSVVMRNSLNGSGNPTVAESNVTVAHNNSPIQTVAESYLKIEESLILESNHIKLDSKSESLSRARAQDKFLGDHKGLAKKLIYICGYAGPQYVVNGKLKECTEACRQLAEWEATLDLLDDFQTDYWWGDSPPTFRQVVEYWGKFLEQRAKPKVSKPKGHQKNAEPTKDHRPDFEKRNGSGYTPEEWAKLSRGESLERH